MDVAVKYSRNKCSNLMFEAKVLKTFNNVNGFPKYYRYKKLWTEQWLVMELLGDSLTKRLKKSGTFSLKSGLSIFQQ
jgi:predicted Ser/Thr protein kinase